MTMPAAGLCESCRYGHLLRSSKGSTFLRCERSFDDPRFPRYPTLPVVRCDGYDNGRVDPTDSVDEPRK